MYLMHRPSGSLVEVLDPTALADPCRAEVPGRFHAGEELQDPETFAKAELAFPSGEPLPRCWVDPHWRERR
ncbi:MAG: acetyltransferase [Gammaproteobacteria bacterium]|nr:MAG: acetyltransferase [Gammaproteobacteria bacterium]